MENYGIDYLVKYLNKEVNTLIVGDQYVLRTSFKRIWW